MNKQQATRLLKHFDEDEVKIVAQAVNDLGTVSKDTVEAIIEEFARDLKSGANLLATTEKIQSLLEGVISPDQIAAIISKTGTTSAHAVWQVGTSFGIGSSALLLRGLGCQTSARQMRHEATIDSASW